MKIAIYATDHGFGHLSRQLGWIEQIKWQPDDEIFIINKDATRIINNDLDINLKVIPRSTDVGPVFNNETFKVDINKTEHSLNDWETKIENQIKIEKEFLKKENINLVVSDISPVPLEASYESSIPSIAISSFSWHWIYESILPDHSILDKIKTMYKTSSETLILPLTEEMSFFKNRKEIPLISRVPHGQVNLISNKKKVFISMGYTVFPNLGGLFSNTEYDFVVPHHLSGDYPVIKIPKEVENITAYLKESDIAILKAGYSSIAEAITLRKPIIAVKRRMIEDEYTGETIDNLGIGRSRYIEDLEDLNLNQLDFESMKLKYDTLPKRYENVGWKEVEASIRRWGE